jgi:uncharacterized membrane protein
MAEDKGQNTASTTKEDVEKNKTMAILAYFIFFLPLLTDAKDSKFAKFHVNQGLLVALLGTASWMLSATLVLAIVGLPLSIVTFIFWILGIMNAANGQMKRLPVIGGIDLIK